MEREVMLSISQIKCNEYPLHNYKYIYIFSPPPLERTVTLLAGPTSFEGEALGGKLLSKPKLEKGELVGSHLKTFEIVRKL